ncbi:MAG TPA: hypothetical protein VMJ10_27775 [Kofleriaceae bacterium]|nr:hypothetical protein [Kofleriaceae bacterium]
MRGSRYLSCVVAFAAFAACSHLPGGGSVPSKPNVPSAPGGLPTGSGEVDPNSCGNYALSDAGAKLKAFLQATKDLQTTTVETLKVVKQSCLMMGKDLAMPDDQLAGDDTKAICNAVFATIQNNLKADLKAGAKLSIKYTPAQCTADASASAGASAACSGAASAGTGGGGAGGQCAAAAQVNASVHVTCTDPQLTIDASAKIVTNKDQIAATLKALRDGLPDLLKLSVRIKPIQDAVTVWAKTASDLKDMGPKFVQSFGDQAMCISGQLAASVNAATQINASVSVSVSVSASASGTVGG